MPKNAKFVFFALGKFAELFDFKRLTWLFFINFKHF